MRIIFIRHGDPDYQHDSLTEKGRREAALLSERVSSWENITEIFCSPLGRAQETASYSLARLGREAITYPWLQEFAYMIDDPTTGRHGVPWDFMPEYWTEMEEMYDKILMAALGVDVDAVVMAKHKYNLGREYRHGGKTV